jgi:hypothetical protein
MMDSLTVSNITFITTLQHVIWYFVTVMA